MAKDDNPQRETGEDETEVQSPEMEQPIEQDVATESVDNRVSPAIKLIKEFLKRAKEKQEARADLEATKEALELEQQSAEIVTPRDENEKVYVTLDGDNIGNVVFQAEQQDDEEKLKDVDRRINSGQTIMKQWAMENNGTVVQAGGDEGLLKVPRKAIERLEELRQRYYDSVKATVTVGVGRKISEAMTARQLGKLQGKDRVVEFDDTTQQELEMRMQQEDADCKERLKACIQAGGTDPRTQQGEEDKARAQEKQFEEQASTPKYVTPDEVMDDYKAQHKEYMQWAGDNHRPDTQSMLAESKPIEVPKEPLPKVEFKKPQQQQAASEQLAPQKPGSPQAAAPEQPKQVQPPEEVKPRIRVRRKKPVTEAARKFKQERDPTRKSEVFEKLIRLRKAIGNIS